MKTNNGSGDTGKPGTISDEDVSSIDVIFRVYGTNKNSFNAIGVAKHNTHRCVE